MNRVILLLTLLLFSADSLIAQTYELGLPDLVLTSVPFEVTAAVEGDSLGIGSYSVATNGQTYSLVERDDGTWVASDVTVSSGGQVQVELLRSGQSVSAAETRAMPGWLSILPPFIAILIALMFKRVIPSLFLGIWFGAMLAVGISVTGALIGLLDTNQVFVLGALTDPQRASVIIFSFMIGGMVGIISKNGGMQGVVNKIVKWADSPKRGQIATGLMGVGIFFDDYANSLVVGNTMRPVTDKLRISREKLAYIVDSTAAPVACIALVTTWIGFEVGLINTALLELPDVEASAYGMFLSSIPYSFYPILAVFFVFLVAGTRKDFGPMYQAELRARTTGQLLAPDAEVDEAAATGKEMAPKEGQPQRAMNAVIPVLVLVVGVMVGLYVTGSDGQGEPLREILRKADSFASLMWASLVSVLVAAILSSAQRILTIGEVVESWYSGLKGMLFAMIILILAWSLSSVTGVLSTGPYLVTVLGDTLSPALVPAIVFVLAAATAFATGSSWGAMGILLPLVMPLTWAVMSSNGMTDMGSYHIMYSSVACILAGSVWGDHCSPISDTTILSSMASGCDHIDHVRTQLPYAMVVGLVAIVLGTIPTGYGLPWWISMVVSGAVLYVGLRLFGKSADDALVEHSESTVATT